MKALELANKQALFVAGKLGAETAAELRRLAEVNAELLVALESLLNYGSLGAYNRADAVKSARKAIAKAKE